MDNVTVNQLAEEFRLDSKVILKELKKIGVMLFSANQPIDPRFVGKVQSHLKLLSNLQIEQEKKAERAKAISKKKVVKTKPKKPELTPLETAMSKDMKIRKADRPGDVRPLAEELIEEELVEDVPVPEEVAPPEAVAAKPAVPVEEGEKKVIRKASKEIIEEIQRKARLEKPPVAPPVEAAAAEVTAVAEAVLPAPPAAPAEKEGLIVREIKKEKKKGKVLKRTSTGPAPQGEADKGFSLFRPTDQHKRRFKKRRRTRGEEVETAWAETRTEREMEKITLPEGLSVKEIAERLNIPVREILKNLFMKGIMVNINQILDADVVSGVAREYGFTVESVSYEEDLFETEFLESDKEHYTFRGPVVTVMGHVDHGKTSLLDAIRQTMVAAKEAGGITQHIGAYKVEVNDRRITFIDTPGHEAFTLMRARGAQITDIVVLVVAADDGVMPQTVEAVQHARAAGVPIVVAINKIDKPNANIDRVKHDLAALDLISEEWGGKNVFCEVSAKKHINIDHLLEMILLVADLQELKANPQTKAMGTVIESRLDRARGPVATLLVQNGTLFERDYIVAGSISGKIRAMHDENNRRIDMAGPSTPVMVLGLENVPQAGEKFFATDDISKARQLSLYRQQKQREELLRKTDTRVSLETLFEKLQQGQIKELPIILKVDVQGSRDAIETLLNRLSTEKVKIRILHSAVGAINENDVLLASASNAIVVGFNVKPSKMAEDLAQRENVDIHFYNVIYTIADDIKKAMEGLLEFTQRETVIGTATVRDTFRITGIGTIAGTYVQDGVIRRDSRVRLFRGGAVVYDSRISSLKRFKEDTTEVKAGYECGVGIENYNDIKVDDELQFYVVEKVKATLDS
ncbi:MAG: translation initiation factor IF-2 [Acidobacteria bacterium]|nr:translation initiation factor IF-2 [Acidobacteriota bacterium]